MEFQAKLEHLIESIEGNMPPSYLKIMHGATRDLENSGIKEKVLKVGQKAPDFKLVNQNGQTVSKHEILAEKKIILTFYRGVWCPYCNADLANLEKYNEEIANEGAVLLGVSPELPKFLKKISLMHKLHYDILHDERNTLADRFGLKFFMPDNLKELHLDKFNINLELNQGNDEWSLPMPARFIIDQEGIIRYAESKADYRRRPDPDELIDVLKSL